MAIEFKENDTVHYGTDGVCKITSIDRKEIEDDWCSYYTLKPVNNNRTTIFVPVDNERLVSRMRPTLSREEVLKLISDMPSQEAKWIDDQGERVSLYKSIITSGDSKRVAQIIKTLYLHREEQVAKGKKAHAVDERLLKRAEELLYDEFAFALDIEPEEVQSFIDDSLNESKSKQSGTKRRFFG